MFKGGAGKGSAGAGVVPDRACSLASMAHPVARHAGLSKFKEFAARSRRARVQAQAGAEAWTDLVSRGLSGLQIYAVERANALQNNESERTRELRTVKQFKEKKIPREGKCSTQANCPCRPA